METEQIIRSWKDEEYRMSLSDAELALIPGDPAALVELSDEDLAAIDGGTNSSSTITSSIPCVIASSVPCAIASITVSAVSVSAYASCVLCG